MEIDIYRIEQLLKAPLYPATDERDIRTLAELVSPDSPEDAMRIIANLDTSGVIALTVEVVRHVVEVSEGQLSQAAADQFSKVWSIKFATLTIPERSKRHPQKLIEYRDASQKALLDAVRLAAKISSGRALSPFGKKIRQRRQTAERPAENPVGYSFIPADTPVLTKVVMDKVSAAHQRLEDHLEPALTISDDRGARDVGDNRLNKEWLHYTRRLRDGDRQVKEPSLRSRRHVIPDPELA